ncbi:MAG: fused MFS/spermidine synthase [Patescibacteria group bacterium]
MDTVEGTGQERTAPRVAWNVPGGILFGVVFISGAAALIYEMLWIRLLGLVFGVGSFALATASAVFLLGIGIGSAVFGRYAEKARDVMRSYAFLEAGIAATSAASFCLLHYTSVFNTIAGYLYASFDFYMLTIARFFVAVLILLVPAIAIGGTIPLLSKYLLTSNRTIGSRFSSLYYWNTFGAVCGVFLAGFVLIRQFGVPVTFWMAAALNGIAAAIVLFTGRRSSPKLPAAIPRSTGEQPDGVHGERLLLPILFATGFITLGFEILWFRVLTNFGSATTFSSTFVLGGFLGGLALGAFYVSRRIDRMQQPVRSFIRYSVLAGLVGACMIFAFSQLHDILPPTFGTYGQLVIESMLGFIFSFVIAAVLGTLFPLGVRLYAGTVSSIGRKTGSAYWINSLGTIAGSVMTGFVLIPFLGVKLAGIILVALCFCVGAVLLVCMHVQRSRAWTFVALSVIGAAFLLILSGSTFHRHPIDAQELFYAEGLSATVTVYAVENGFRTDKYLEIDGQGVAGTYATGVIDAKILAHLPLLLTDSPQKVATVGYGSGITSYSMALHGTEVYALEIEREVIEAAGQFREYNHSDEANELLTIIVDDARNYLQYTEETFDAIVTDVTNLKYKSNASLYTVDYFQVMRDRLSPHGVAAAWVPLGGVSPSDLKILTASFHEVFPHTTVWYFNQDWTGFLVFVGTPEKLEIDITELEGRFELVRGDLGSIGVESAYELSAMLLLGEGDVASYVAGAPLHTDDRPILEFSDIKYYAQYSPMSNLRDLLLVQQENLSGYFILNEEQDSELLDTFYAGRELIKHFIEESS